MRELFLNKMLKNCLKKYINRWRSYDEN